MVEMNRTLDNVTHAVDLLILRPDEYDQEKPQDQKSIQASKKIKDIINRHKEGVETAVSDAINQNSSMSTHKDFINKLLGFAISEDKNKDRENLEIQRQAKPRWDPTKTPKAGTFSKDTKKMKQRSFFYDFVSICFTYISVGIIL